MSAIRTQLLQERGVRMDEAQRAFERFLGSELATDLVPFLKQYLRVDPLMMDTPEKTAFKVGLLHAITEIENLQKQVKGEVL